MDEHQRTFDYAALYDDLLSRDAPAGIVVALERVLDDCAVSALGAAERGGESATVVQHSNHVALYVCAAFVSEVGNRDLVPTLRILLAELRNRVDNP